MGECFIVLLQEVMSLKSIDNAAKLKCFWSSY